MPNQAITVRRWQIAAVFVLFVVSLVFAVWLANRHTNARIDEAEMRINKNTASIASAKARAEVAQEQARHAREVSADQHKTIHILCGEIKAIKAQIVQTLEASAGSAQTFVGRLPGYTQEDADRAEARLQQALSRFAPRPCPPKEMEHG